VRARILELAAHWTIIIAPAERDAAPAERHAPLTVLPEEANAIGNGSSIVRTPWPTQPPAPPTLSSSPR